MKKHNYFINAGLMLLIAGAVATYFTFFNNGEEKLIPDYAKGTLDTSMIKEDDDTEVKKSEGGNTLSLNYSGIALIKNTRDKIKMYFKNPATSTENVVIYLVLTQNNKEYVIGESGLIPPGYAIYEMPVSNLPKLEPGGYNGLIRVISYNQETNARNMIGSDLKISIEVE